MTLSPNQSSLSSQYIYGGIGGMFGIILSHPLDTIKTHIQTGKSFSAFKPSITNLYRGITVPLIGVGIEKAIVFGTYNYIMKKTNCIPLSGAIAGLSASLIVSPYERLKILKQSSQSFKISPLYILNPQFMFKGLGVTFTREVPGFAIYFSVYEHLKYTTYTQHNKEITGLSSFIYGGVSGLTAWIFIYPQDKIKTIIQSNTHSNTHSNTQSNIHNTKNVNSIVNIVKNMYSTYGITYFYKGFSWAAGRAMLLHSGTFCAIEALNAKEVIDSVY